MVSKAKSSSLPDAIQAHTRALLGADHLQTPTILAKLASLHQTISGGSLSTEAISFHQRLLALGEKPGKTGLTIGEMAGSYLAVAEWEVCKGSSAEFGQEGRRGRGVKGGEGVHGKEVKDGGGVEGRGDWALAAQYLEKVAGSNVPQRDRAEELLRELRVREARLAADL